MLKSKKLFLLFVGLFVIAMIIIGIDISRKTTFPGSKKHLKESIMPSKDNEKTELPDSLPHQK